MIYDCVTGSFSELRGEGLVLGFEHGRQYQENIVALGGAEQIILIGSDGVWEAENPKGERFGRDRVKSLLAASCHLSPDDIIALITREIARFGREQPQGDDITLVIVKIM